MHLLTNLAVVLTLAAFSFNDWAVESILLQQNGLDFPEFYVDESPDSFQRIPNAFYPEIPEQRLDRDAESNQESTAYLFPRLTVEPQRLARQKNCRWTGCHKLPVGKGNSCPQGLFLESYKVCDPKGSSNINIQCCS
ncbi:unnamed protein product [Orchesella dallaii]|uniref:Secreted protein n=1 Tax=Orchesella dallaii TaxID=48710 RepID=A0ABP1QQY5_9HEXA